jgi:two-component sensor histidine kinase
LFLTLLIAFVSYRGYKKNLLINKLLEKQKSEISRQNEAKKTMLQEIHHRVKNNLQVVNSLLRMQSSKMKDKNILGMFKETQSRIRSMAKLHEKMYQSGDLDKFNAKEHITLLVEEIVTNYSVGKTIELNLDIDAIFVDSKTMMPLSLIINEMISNSLKYAFEGREEGTIEVKFNKVKNEKTQLIIRDNGVGYTPNPKSKGLGLRLITSFTKQLNGQMEKITNNGTTFKLIY